MNRLLFDVGNTRVKWAWDCGAGLEAPGEFLHRTGAWPERLDSTRRPDAVYAVNVAGAAAAERLRSLVAASFGADVHFARTSARCGSIVNGYVSVEQLGVDRWAAVVGAWHRYREALCVVDAGTAVTIDLIAADGCHAGGLILPGLRLMTSALKRDTSDIAGFAAHRADLPDEHPFGRDTASAVERGARLAISAAIRESAQLMSAKAVVLTGGDAAFFENLTGCEVRLRPLLVLEGLRCLIDEPGGRADA